jgi:hypothetical protein
MLYGNPGKDCPGERLKKRWLIKEEQWLALNLILINAELVEISMVE